MSSDRRGQASSTLRNVKERHEAIQKIEQQMVELAQLFQDLDQIVQQQEPLVENIEQKGEEIHENVVQANTEIGGAIEKARSARRKKWWCLLICESSPKLWVEKLLTPTRRHHRHHHRDYSSHCCQHQQQKMSAPALINSSRNFRTTPTISFHLSRILMAGPLLCIIPLGGYGALPPFIFQHLIVSEKLRFCCSPRSGP